MSDTDGRLRVCIADDHLLMLHGVRDALLKAGDIDGRAQPTGAMRYAYQHGLISTVPELDPTDALSA